MMTVTQRRVFEILVHNVGDTVPYSEFSRAISCKTGTENLRQNIRRLRIMGLRIENIRRLGYRLVSKELEMPHVIHDFETQCYAQDIQEAIHGAMRKHAEVVGFEPQIAIMGVAIGAILHQLPMKHRKQMTRILLKNINLAPEFSKVMRMQ